MEWEEYKTGFYQDGSLRDIYVLNTELADWQEFIEFLKASHYSVRFSLNREQIDLPSNIGLIFQNRPMIDPLLTIDVEGIVVHCYFFQVDEIEMDLDPRHVTNELKAQTIFIFMREVAKALDKPIRMTPENMGDSIIFMYEPRIGTLRYWDGVSPIEINSF